MGDHLVLTIWLYPEEKWISPIFVTGSSSATWSKATEITLLSFHRNWELGVLSLLFIWFSSSTLNLFGEMGPMYPPNKVMWSKLVSNNTSLLNCLSLASAPEQNPRQMLHMDSLLGKWSQGQRKNSRMQVEGSKCRDYYWKWPELISSCQPSERPQNMHDIGPPVVNLPASLGSMSAREVPAGVPRGCVGPWVRKREVGSVSRARSCQVVSAQCCCPQNGWIER